MLMNRLLTRQLCRHFGDLQKVPKELDCFLQTVSDTYNHHDQDRLLVERSLEISSEELSAVNSELRSIFMQFPDIFFRLDRTGLILDYQITDTHDLFETERDLVGKYIQNIPNKGISSSFKTAIISVNRNQRKESFEYSMSLNKKNHFFEANLIPIFHKQIIVFIRDISERKRVERELKIAKERAVQSDNLKSAFLANMSHEIRSPMNSILGFAELLEDEDISAENRVKYTSIIKASGNHLLDLICDIIDISKIEAGQLAINYDECITNDVMQEIYELFLAKDKVQSKQLDLLVNCPLSNQETTIITDSLRLKQVLINLLGNSLKFTDSGYVEFGYSLVDTDQGKMMQFYVKDTGRGISKEVSGLIFRRFTQDLKNPAVVLEGTGLGLAISKEIVELLGGTMWFTSKIRKGSQFYFTLPYN